MPAMTPGSSTGLRWLTMSECGLMVIVVPRTADHAACRRRVAFGRLPRVTAEEGPYAEERRG
jgi:hypothetical protein